MTERGRRSLRRDASTLTIGRSGLHWDGASLDIAVDEVGAPIPARVRGRIRLTPTALTGRGYTLDDHGRHRWRPIAPHGRIDVALDSPRLDWSGAGYFDGNSGDRPLEADFVRWDWSRAGLTRDTAVLYDVTRRVGGDLSLALRFDRAGRVEALRPPPACRLPTTAWGVERRTRADAGYAADVSQTLENAPFYARSILSTRLCGEAATAVHESLSLDRFKAPWVQMMLPFRMPRIVM